MEDSSGGATEEDPLQDGQTTCTEQHQFKVVDRMSDTGYNM